MKAFCYHKYGEVDQCHVETLPVPQPAGSQLRIRVLSAALNPIDFKRRKGDLKMMISETFPVTVGYDVAGVVDAVGREASAFRVGELVCARTSVFTNNGTLADYTLCDETDAALINDMSPNEAAGLPLAGLTALQMLRKASIKAGDKVLITAGAGGVGHFAIQIAKALGASLVVATASAAKHNLLRSLGADECIDYTEKDPWASIPDHHFDVALDNTSEVAKIIPKVRPGGSVVSTVQAFNATTLEENGIPAGCFMRFVLWLMSRSLYNAAQSANVHLSGIMMRASGEDLRFLAGLAGAGKLKTVVLAENVFRGLEHAGEAMNRLESGRATGKIVVEVSST